MQAAETWGRVTIKNWKPVDYASPYVNNTENRYAPIERPSPPFAGPIFHHGKKSRLWKPATNLWWLYSVNYIYCMVFHLDFNR